MRSTSTASYYAYYLGFITLLLFGVPQLVAATVTITPLDGCFLHDATTVHVAKPVCQASLTNDSATDFVTTITFENVDPNAVDFTGVSATFTDREKNSFTAELTVPVGSIEFTLGPWYDLGDDYYFIALSDNQARGTVETNPIFEDVLAQVAVVNPPFFTNAGDLITGSDKVETLTDMFDAVQNTLSEVYSPMYPVPGNHDYGDALVTYRELFGAVDYSYDVGSVHFVALSTVGAESRGQVSTEQLTWLENELPTNQPHTIVYFHHPLSVPSWGKSTCCFVDVVNRNDLADRLDQFTPDLIITGHSQGYDYRELTSADISTIVNGFPQLVTGGGGGTIAQPNGDYHYTLVHVAPTGVTSTPIYEDDFGLAVEYENNQGTTSQATAIVENDSNNDLPFMRLRFRLNTTATDFTISDDLGTYYSDYDQHAYADYTVVYVTIPISANSTRTISITPATELHSGTTQTVTPTGNVSYEVAPSSSATASHLSAQPTYANVLIANLVEAKASLTWEQTATVENEITTYSLTNLEPIQPVDLFIDTVLLERAVADAAGEVEFSVPSADISQHSLQIARLPVAAEQVITVPSLTGDPQLRLFDASGAVRGQWYAFPDNILVTQPYSLWQANVTGDSAAEIIMAGQTSAGRSVELYTQAGTVLATAELALEPIMADIDGDGFSNLVYYRSKQRYVRSLSYNSDTSAFTLERWLVPKSDRSNRLELLTASDTDHDGQAELAFFDKTRNRFMVLQVQANQLVMTGQYSLPRGSTITALASGQLDTGRTQAWVVAYQNKHAVSQVAVLQPSNTGLNFQRTKSLRSAHATINQILVAPVVAGKLDRLLVSTTTNGITLYRPNHQAGFTRLQKISTALGSNGPIRLSWLSGSENYPRQLVVTETNQPGQLQIWRLAAATKRFQAVANWYGYGENFNGGTTVAD